jgi:hypothetical protein
LTETGRRVLALYRQMERESLAATKDAFRELRALLAC